LQPEAGLHFCEGKRVTSFFPSRTPIPRSLNRRDGLEVDISSNFVIILFSEAGSYCHVVRIEPPIVSLQLFADSDASLRFFI
jgi:hypothetical protein